MKTLTHFLPFALLAAGFPAIDLNLKQQHTGVTSIANTSLANSIRSCARESWMYCGPTTDAIKCAIAEGTTCGDACEVESTNSWCSSNCKCSDQKLSDLSDGSVYFSAASPQHILVYHSTEHAGISKEHTKAHVFEIERQHESSASNFKFTALAKEKKVDDIHVDEASAHHDKRYHNIHIDKDVAHHTKRNHDVHLDEAAATCQLSCNSNEMLAMCHMAASCSNECYLSVNSDTHGFCSSMCTCSANGGTAVDHHASTHIKRSEDRLDDGHFQPVSLGDIEQMEHMEHEEHMKHMEVEDHMPAGDHINDHVLVQSSLEWPAGPGSKRAMEDEHDAETHEVTAPVTEAQLPVEEHSHKVD